MFSKIEISGKIELITGMHIGATDRFSAIGAIDTPVIKDVISGLPMIPGSSIKGKMRTLLAKMLNENAMVSYENDHEYITRLFGTSKDKTTGNPVSSRLIFSDSIMDNMDEIKEIGVESSTEAKEENSISRLTGIANHRVIERVIRGATFPLSIIYNGVAEEEILQDMKTLSDGLKLLTTDYIGGHGSRGYGRIAISDINIDVIIGDVDESILEESKTMFEGI